jgi:hypothetical protein
VGSAGSAGNVDSHNRLRRQHRQRRTRRQNAGIETGTKGCRRGCGGAVWALGGRHGARRSTPLLQQQPQVLEFLQVGWFASSIGHHIEAAEIHAPAERVTNRSVNAAAAAIYLAEFCCTRGPCSALDGEVPSTRSPFIWRNHQ